MKICCPHCRRLVEVKAANQAKGGRVRWAGRGKRARAKAMAAVARARWAAR